MDDLLAQHIAHLFNRDPVSLFAEKLIQDTEKESDHFEVSNTVQCVYQCDFCKMLSLCDSVFTCMPLCPSQQNIQSTNWQSMRFKPPPPGCSIGWRVEFRPLDVQLTDFENTAFVVFVVLLTRAILSFGLNFYIPISKVCMDVLQSCAL